MGCGIEILNRRYHWVTELTNWEACFTSGFCWWTGKFPDYLSQFESGFLLFALKNNIKIHISNLLVLNTSLLTAHLCIQLNWTPYFETHSCIYFLWDGTYFTILLIVAVWILDLLMFEALGVRECVFLFRVSPEWLTAVNCDSSGWEILV